MPPCRTLLDSASSINLNPLSDDSGRAAKTTIGVKVEERSIGKCLDASDIYSTMLDRMVTTANLGITAQHPYVDGVSSTTNYVLHMRLVGQHHSLKHSAVWRALAVLSDDKTGFKTRSQEHKLARGWVMRLGTALAINNPALESES